MLINNLSESNDIHEKKIICIEKSEEYLRELEQKYPDIFDRVTAIVDDYKREHGEFEIDDKNIPVYDMSYLASIDWKEYAFVITSDYYKQAFINLQRLYGEKHKTVNIYYFLNESSEKELMYQRKYANDKLKDLIVFRSGPHASAYIKGMDFADNSRAIFEYMLANGYNEKYELVWYVKNPKEFEKYLKYKNVHFYSFEWSNSDDESKRDLYYDALYHAKYIFFTDAYGFARNCRENQIRIQLWHGCGFKTRTNFVSCEHRYEFNIVIGEKYKQIHKEIYGLRDDQVIVTGYPKEDQLFHPVPEEKIYRLGIPKSSKYIFWLPTFRTAAEQLSILNEQSIESEVGLPIIYKYDDIKRINDILVKQDMVMVIKLHPFQKKNSVHFEKLSNIVLLENNQLVEADIEINGLLAWADALISDYSSAAVDYLILNKPIAFTLDDVEEYSSSRGFVFDNIREWLPGKEIFTVDEFAEYVSEIGNGIDSEKEKRNRIRNIFHKFDDDLSSRRVLESFNIIL